MQQAFYPPPARSPSPALQAAVGSDRRRHARQAPRRHPRRRVARRDIVNPPRRRPRRPGVRDPRRRSDHGVGRALRAPGGADLQYTSAAGHDPRPCAHRARRRAALGADIALARRRRPRRRAAHRPRRDRSGRPRSDSHGHGAAPRRGHRQQLDARHRRRPRGRHAVVVPRRAPGHAGGDRRGRPGRARAPRPHRWRRLGVPQRPRDPRRDTDRRRRVGHHRRRTRRPPLAGALVRRRGRRRHRRPRPAHGRREDHRHRPRSALAAVRHRRRPLRRPRHAGLGGQHLLGPPEHGVTPMVHVTNDSADSMDAFVTGARTGQPFWLVLGQSQTPGWTASVDGVDLGPPTLIDGYANGWRIDPTVQAMHVSLQFAPQRVVNGALLVSALAALVCLFLAFRGGRPASHGRSLRSYGRHRPTPRSSPPRCRGRPCAAKGHPPAAGRRCPHPVPRARRAGRRRSRGRAHHRADRCRWCHAAPVSSSRSPLQARSCSPRPTSSSRRSATTSRPGSSGRASSRRRTRSGGSR